MKGVNEMTTVRVQKQLSAATNNKLWDEVSIKSELEKEEKVNNILKNNLS